MGFTRLRRIFWDKFFRNLVVTIGSRFMRIRTSVLSRHISALCHTAMTSHYQLRYRQYCWQWNLRTKNIGEQRTNPMCLQYRMKRASSGKKVTA